MKSPLLDLMEIITVLLGCFSTGVSGGLAAYFWCRSGALARGFAIQLAGECFISGLVLLFAALAMLDALNDFPVWGKLTLRVLMFSVASATSLHLGAVIQRISNDK